MTGKIASLSKKAKHKDYQELKHFIKLTKEKISQKEQETKDHLMNLVQYHLRKENEGFTNQFNEIKKNLIEVEDKINTFRTPPILIKKVKRKDLIEQIKIVIFYMELILIEIETLSNQFQNAVNQKEDHEIVQSVIVNFNQSYNRLKKLTDQMEAFSKYQNYKDIYEIIEPRIAELYPKPKEIKKILKLSKNLKISEIEKAEVPRLYEENNKSKIKKQKLKRENKKVEEMDESEGESIFHRVFNRIFFNVSEYQDLIDLINHLGDSIINKEHGGIIKLSALYNLIKGESSDIQFTARDLERVLEYMEKKGFISHIKEYDGLKLVQFVPLELSKDPMELLNSVDIDGKATKETLMKRLDWSESRIQKVLDFLIDKGICKETGNDLMGKKYYFPGLE